MYRSAYSKAKSFYHERRNAVLAVSAAVLLAITSLLFINLSADNPVQPAQAAIKPMPLSRAILMVAEEQIRFKKPPPTEAAREYAYIASAYDEGLSAGGQSGAVFAAGKMMEMFFADQSAAVNTKLNTLAETNHLTSYGGKDIPLAVAQVITKYQNRNLGDRHDLAWDGVIPTGMGKWVKKTSKDPLTPRAGDWQRWIVSKAIAVPPPPIPGSAEDIKQIETVLKASANRNGDDINKINFWGGTPGTDTPSGIWQNQLYKTVHARLPLNQKEADRQYSELQSVLAQTLSDSFMECWKVKYTYWTARPDMRVNGIITAMDNPNFPGYISGHSTISKAAADVLAVMVPSQAQSWQEMATEARDSRLKAGIHFDIDNQVGFDVGGQVAAQVIQAKNLQMVL